ncbi:MAG: hypothetical protein M3O30_02510 [Planctomycetota bacterium]|nr:hypothetical protein [Planctomycetota bacterium]
MLNDSELARRNGGRIEVRAGGLRVSWEIADLVTRDGHAAVLNFSCTARGLPSVTEQKMLEEAFLSRKESVGIGDVSVYLASAIKSAANDQVRRQDAEALLSEVGQQGLIQSLMKGGQGIAFGCGIELLPPLQLEIDCPTLRRQQTQQRRAAEANEHLRRSGELFAQFESIRARAPELSPGEVLGRIGVADQVDLLRSLLRASAEKGRGKRLWAAAGTALVAISDGEAPAMRLIPLPTGLGPARSVRSDSMGNLWVGCQSGVMRVRPDSAESAILYHDPEVSSRLGFNAAIATSDLVWATHSEAGLVCWRLDQPDAPAKAIRPGAAKPAGLSARNLIGLDSGQMIFSSGRQLMKMNAGGEVEPIGPAHATEVLAIVSSDEQIITVHEDGMVCTRAARDPAEICQQRRTGKITAAAALPWLDDVRLLLATEDGPVLCVGLEDELVTQYASGHRAPRIVVGIAQTVAAVSSDRQRLILWNSWDGRKPFAELHVANLVQHRIADIGFG